MRRGHLVKSGVSIGIVTALALGASSWSTAAQSKRAPRYQFGINTYVTYGCQPVSTYLSWATTEFKEYKALGANSIALAFPLYIDSLTSNDVYAKLDCSTYAYQTPTPTILAELVTLAHKTGFRSSCAR